MQQNLIHSVDLATTPICEKKVWKAPVLSFISKNNVQLKPSDSEESTVKRMVS